MTTATDVKKKNEPHLKEQFFQLLDMDRNDPEFETLYHDVHKKIDALVAEQKQRLS